MNQPTSYACRSARPAYIAAQSKTTFWCSFVVTASLLLPTFALATIAQAQISYDTGFETQFDSGQVSYETELVQPQVVAPAYGYEIAAETLPQQTYATTPQATSSGYQTYTSARTSGSTGNVQPGLAQQKAQQAAQMGLQGHLGGSLGGANYEGVGWSNHSAQNAIHSCCYWGTRPTAQIGVAKGNNGFWYACVLYH